jgi:hypothetical protein
MKARILRTAPRVLGLGVLVLLVRSDVSGAEAALDARMLNSMRAQGTIQFGLSSGRIVTAVAPGVNRNDTGTTLGVRRERLTVRGAGAVPTISYEMSNAAEQLTLSVSGRNRFQIRRCPKGDRAEPVAVEFHQAPLEPLTLTVGAKDRQRTYRATSIWHLFLLEPKVCGDRLAPLLKIVFGEFDFEKSGQEVEANLIRTASTGIVPDWKRWDQLVQQLGDSSFAAREAADRKLRAEGRIAAAYLQRLDLARLDAEQRYRVRRILQSLTDEGDESPPRIANWLSGDPVAWFALLARDDPATRRLAVQRLSNMLGGTLEFDPEGDAKLREKQIEALRPRVLRN